MAITAYLATAYTSYQTQNSSEKPNMSIIIAAKDESENLQKLIPKLIDQTYEYFEIIVALDRCQDDSLSYLKNFPNIQFITIAEVPPDWNPKKFALQKAIERSTGDWLAFTDADCILSSNNWLASIAQAISPQTDIVIGISPYIRNHSFISQYIQFESFMTAFLYTARALKKKPYMAVGRNMAIRKSFFEQKNGYEHIKSIKGGDDDLFIQQNAHADNVQVLLGKSSIVYSYPKKTWKSYFQQKLRHVSVGAKYNIKDLLFLNVFHLSHLLFIILLFLNTAQFFFLPILVFYLLIKMGSYRFATNKMGISTNYIVFTFVDMLYAILTPVIALWSKLVKDITWKN